MQSTRSELVERTFAPMCATGGARRGWLRGIDKVKKDGYCTRQQEAWTFYCAGYLESGPPDLCRGLWALSCASRLPALRC